MYGDNVLMHCKKEKEKRILGKHFTYIYTDGEGERLRISTLPEDRNSPPNKIKYQNERDVNYITTFNSLVRGSM